MYNDDDAEMEYIFLYTADGFTGELADCNEGTLEWVPKTEIDSLNLWEGDRIFHRLLDEEAPFFSLKLRYQDDLLKEAAWTESRWSFSISSMRLESRRDR